MGLPDSDFLTVFIESPQHIFLISGVLSEGDSSVISSSSVSASVVLGALFFFSVSSSVSSSSVCEPELFSCAAEVLAEVSLLSELPDEELPQPVRITAVNSMANNFDLIRIPPCFDIL